MILSAQQIFSNAQAVTVDAISTNVIDLGVAGTPFGGQAPLNRDVGKGNPIYVLVQVVIAFVTTVSIQITLENSAAAGLTSSIILADETVLVADLVAGKQMFMQLLPNGITLRYLGLRYNVTTTATAGAFTAGISMGNQTNITGP